MENCNTGISIITTEEICAGKYTSTDCTSIPNNITYLDVSAGDSQTEVNAALVTALMYKDEQLGSLTISTETQMALDLKANLAGTQTFTGIHNFPTAAPGTNTTQVATAEFVLANAGGTLQSVLNSGSYAEVDGGNSHIEILSGTAEDRTLYYLAENSTFTKGGELLIRPGKVLMDTWDGDNTAAYNTIDGRIRIESKIISSNLKTYIEINDPLITSTLKFPSKTIADTYTINTTPDTVYTVAMLPTAVLNDMAIVSDATAPTYLGALTGGGTVVAPVWYNGTIWVSR